MRRVFQAAWLALALALVGGVEGEGDEALLGQASRVQACGLFLHAASGMPDDDRPARAGGVVGCLARFSMRSPMRCNWPQTSGTICSLWPT
jgi:hypothetical protein